MSLLRTVGAMCITFSILNLETARGDDFATIQKALPAIKKDICDLRAVSNLFTPPETPSDLRFKHSIKIDDDIFKKECLAATSTDLIDIAASRRAGSCKELCQEQISWKDSIRLNCADACRETNVGITLRLMYFKKGMESAIEAGCGPTSNIGRPSKSTRTPVRR